MLFYSVTFQCSECTDSILCPDYVISDFAARTHSATWVLYLQHAGFSFSRTSDRPIQRPCYWCCPGDVNLLVSTYLVCIRSRMERNSVTKSCQLRTTTTTTIIIIIIIIMPHRGKHYKIWLIFWTKQQILLTFHLTRKKLFVWYLIQSIHARKFAILFLTSV